MATRADLRSRTAAVQHRRVRLCNNTRPTVAHHQIIEAVRSCAVRASKCRFPTATWPWPWHRGLAGRAPCGGDVIMERRLEMSEAMTAPSLPSRALESHFLGRGPRKADSYQTLQDRGEATGIRAPSAPSAIPTVQFWEESPGDG